MLYLAQFSTPTAAETLAAYQALQNSIQTKLDGLWDTHFYNTSAATGGGMFGIVCNVMAPFALLALVGTFFVEFQKHKHQSPVLLAERLLVPALVLTLLLGEGNLLKGVIGGVRGATNVTVSAVLAQMQVTSNINNTLQDGFGDQDLVAEFRRRANECNSGPSADKMPCLQRLQTDIQNAVNTGQIRNTRSANSLTSLANNIGAAIASGDITKATDLALGGLARLNPVTNITIAIISYVMAGVSAAIQLLLEIAQLLTALIAPVFVMMGLLPSGGRAILSWMSAFWGIFLFKLCYSIIVGLSASFFDIEGLSPLYMGITSAILAPLLAGILATGGGMGFYNAALSLGAKAVEVGMGMASGGATTAVSTAISVSRATK